MQPYLLLMTISLSVSYISWIGIDSIFRNQSFTSLWNLQKKKIKKTSEARNLEDEKILVIHSDRSDLVSHILFARIVKWPTYWHRWHHMKRVVTIYAWYCFLIESKPNLELSSKIACISIIFITVKEMWTDYAGMLVTYIKFI